MAFTAHGIANLIIAILGIMICCFLLLVLLIGRRKEKVTATYMTFAFVSMLAYNICLFWTELLRFYDPVYYYDGWRIALVMLGFGTFLYSVITAFVVSSYTVYLVKPRNRVRRKLRVILAAMLVLYLGTFLILQLTGRLVRVTALGGYTEGKFAFIGHAMVASFMGADLIMLMKMGNNLSKAQRNAYSVYFAMPLLATFLRVLDENVYMVAFSSNLAMAIMMILLMKEQAEEFREQEIRNEQLKVDILLGQIQPHFLFNALYVIQEICHIDPEKASDAIGEFSRYLRHNMDSLLINTPIPFKDELEHAKHYVSLQQLRFGDALDVRYELTCTEFYMPTLTLQPIVENAVRYGVRKNSTGKGSVTVRTKEFQDHYEVEVIDDGPGFDTNEEKQDGISHTGLKNVRERLKRICDGDLLIFSELGKGTAVTIVLPKKS